jgi:malonyl-CoA O-methyltransferase
MPDLDQSQLRRACDRVASGYDTADFLCAEVRARLFERLELVTLQPTSILDLGSGTGAATDHLQRLYPDTLVVALDRSEAMLATTARRGEAGLCAAGERLPLADASVDIVVSNLMLPACDHPAAVFAEVRRVLKAPGLFLFSTLGPDSMKEMRRAWARVDKYPHVHDHDDMHIIGDMLVHAGFREPVMDVEMLTIQYGDIATQVRDLRSMAASNFARRRVRGLTTPRRWQQVSLELEKDRNENGKLPVTVELITGQAWTGAPDIGVRLENGEARFPISRLT